MRNILTAALALFAVVACETYSPNPARRAPGEGKEVTVNVNVPSASAPHSDATTADAAAPATDSGESPEADAAIEESDSHHPNPGQGGHQDAAVTEADAEVVNVEPDAAAETSDAAEEPHQAPDSDIVDQAPDAAAPVVPREICVQVHPECVLIATSDDETNDNGDPLEGIRFQPSGSFCFSVVEGENVTALVNAITPVPDANGDFIYALSVTARNQDGNWCDNGLPGRQSNMRVDETCFVGETPSQLGFVPHCTVRDGDGWTMNWRWSNQH